MGQEFLGKGLKFPIQVDAETGGLAVSSGEDKIRESVIIVLSTVLGERVMRPQFGSELYKQVFAPINTSTMSSISFGVQKALLAWEPRIEVENVRISGSKAREGILLISIDYKIRATNTKFNLVYPFFIKGFAG